jgi:hypothetical protein
LRAEAATLTRKDRKQAEARQEFRHDQKVQLMFEKAESRLR